MINWLRLPTAFEKRSALTRRGKRAGRLTGALVYRDMGVGEATPSFIRAPLKGAS